MLCFVRSLGLLETGGIWEWWRTWRRDTLLHFFFLFSVAFLAYIIFASCIVLPRIMFSLSLFLLLFFTGLLDFS